MKTVLVLALTVLFVAVNPGNSQKVNYQQLRAFLEGRKLGQKTYHVESEPAANGPIPDDYYRPGPKYEPEPVNEADPLVEQERDVDPQQVPYQAEVEQQSYVDSLQLSLTLKDSNIPGTQQNLYVDETANTVVHHFVQNEHDVTICNDFNRDLQVLKIISDASVGCYVTPLNRSYAVDLPTLNTQAFAYAKNAFTPLTVSSATEVDLIYDVAPNSINDTSFLGPRATALCKNIPVYWLQPTCVASPVVASISSTRSKRGLDCSCGWQTCRTCIFGHCITWTCNYQCTCCLFGGCLTVSLLSPCAVCVMAGNFFSGVCNLVCKALFGM